MIHKLSLLFWRRTGCSALCSRQDTVCRKDLNNVHEQVAGSQRLRGLRPFSSPCLDAVLFLCRVGDGGRGRGRTRQDQTDLSFWSCSFACQYCSTIPTRLLSQFPLLRTPK